MQDAQRFVHEQLADDLGDHVAEVPQREVEVVVDAFSHLLDEQLLLFSARRLVARRLGERRLQARYLRT